MKIGLLTGRFYPQLCGIGDYTFLLAKELARNKNEIYIITITEREDIYFQNLEGVNILRIVRKWAFSDITRIARHLRKLSIDVVNFQFAHFAYDRRGINLWIYLLLWYLRLFTRVNLIVTIHEPYIPFYPSLKLIALGLWQRFTLFLTCYASNRIVVTVERWKKSLKSIGIFKKAVVIPVGSSIIYREFSKNEKKQTRESLNIDETKVVLASFGNLHVSKNFKLILEVLRELKWRGIKFIFIWIGGNLAEMQIHELKKTVSIEGLSDEVFFTGYLDHTGVQRYLSIVDIFIAPFSDGVSTRRTSVITAMSYALPVISTHSEFSDAVFVHQKNMFLLSNRVDAKGLCEAIELLKDDMSLRKKIADGALKTFREEFEWNVIAKRFLRIYQSLSNG